MWRAVLVCAYSGSMHRLAYVTGHISVCLGWQHAQAGLCDGCVGVCLQAGMCDGLCWCVPTEAACTGWHVWRAVLVCAYRGSMHRVTYVTDCISVCLQWQHTQAGLYGRLCWCVPTEASCTGWHVRRAVLVRAYRGSMHRVTYVTDCISVCLQWQHTQAGLYGRLCWCVPTVTACIGWLVWWAVLVGAYRGSMHRVTCVTVCVGVCLQWQHA